MRAGVVDGRAALRAHRSNRLVDVEGCMVVHPLLAELLDGPRFDGAREVLLRCGARTGERLAVANPRPHAPRVPKDVRSDLFHEIAAGRRWRVSARAFFQARPDGVDALAALVAEAAGALAEELGGPGRAVDLYSGVGVFAGALAEAGWTVTAVEGSERAVSDAKVNLEGLDVEIAKDDVARWRPTGADLVVTDPSRDGLGRGVARVIEATGARRVVLISCDAGSLGRDAASLVSAGFRLESVTPVDLFPQTFRVEVVTVYDRAQGPTGAGG
jgi:23S rRNA (uracil1939-C5)-methyltransferase